MCPIRPAIRIASLGPMEYEESAPRELNHAAGRQRRAVVDDDHPSARPLTRVLRSLRLSSESAVETDGHLRNGAELRDRTSPGNEKRTHVRLNAASHVVKRRSS